MCRALSRRSSWRRTRRSMGWTSWCPMPPVVSDTVTVDYAIDLRLVADVTNASLQEIVALNPSLLRMTTPRDMPFDLHIPVGTSELFASRIKQIPEDKRASWRFHVVRDGRDAGWHRGCVSCSRQRDCRGQRHCCGRRVSMPAMSWSFPSPAPLRAAHPQRYTVRRGDTLITVADRFGVSVEAAAALESSVVERRRAGASAAVSRAGEACAGIRVRAEDRRMRGAASRTVFCVVAHEFEARSTVHSKSKSTFVCQTAAKTSRKQSTLQNEIEKLHDKLPRQKDCLPSLALGCILLLESRARM